MRTDCINNTNFQGNLIITNQLSDKPSKCLNKVGNDIENIVCNKDYDLCIMQDYKKNAIRIKVNYPLQYMPSEYQILSDKTEEKLPINAKASRYIDAAKSVINRYETSLKQQKEKQWEKERQKAELQDIGKLFASLVYLPILLIFCGICEGAKEISQDVKTMFNKAKKFAIKKG